MQNAIAYALENVGNGYAYGATGWVCTRQRLEAVKRQYPDKIDVEKLYRLWKGKKCFDCAQLTKYALKRAGVNLPSGATSQWRSGLYTERGELSALDRARPAQVFTRKKGTTNTMSHTGLYLGDGTVVHAKGSDWGVIREKLEDCSFTHYAYPALPDAPASAEPAASSAVVPSQSEQIKALEARVAALEARIAKWEAT